MIIEEKKTTKCVIFILSTLREKNKGVGSPRGIMGYVLACNFKGSYIVLLQFFNKDSFGIK